MENSTSTKPEPNKSLDWNRIIIAVLVVAVPIVLGYLKGWFDKIIPSPNPNNCPSIVGTFKRDHDGLTMLIDQTDCNISSEFNDRGFDYELKGKWIANDSSFNVAVVRKNKGDNCVDRMYGSIKKSDDNIKVTYSGTNANCNLQADYHESYIYYRK